MPEACFRHDATSGMTGKIGIAAPTVYAASIFFRPPM